MEDTRLSVPPFRAETAYGKRKDGKVVFGTTLEFTPLRSPPFYSFDRGPYKGSFAKRINTRETPAANFIEVVEGILVEGISWQVQEVVEDGPFLGEDADGEAATDQCNQEPG